MKLTTKVAYNTIIQILSKILSTILGLVAVSIMARSLGTSGFGAYTTITTFLSFFAVFIDMGLTLVTVQLISPLADDENGQREESRILGNLLSFRLISAALLLGIAPIISLFLPYGPDLRTGIAVGAASFFFIALNQIMVGLFQKRLRMDKLSIAEVVSRLVLVLGVICSARWEYGVEGVIWSTVLSSFVSFCLHFLFARKFTRLTLHFDLALWKDFIIRSWPLATTIIFNLIYLRADTLILSLIKSQDEVGIYGAAYKVLDVVTTIPFMFAGIVLPILTARWINGKKEEFRQALQRSLDFMIILALPMIAGTMMLAKPIIVTVAGPDFAAAGIVLSVLIWAAGIIFVGCMFSHAIIALGQQKQIIKAYVFTAVTALIGYLIFIPRYSYLGAAGVTIYSELSIALAAAWLVMKYSRFRLQGSILAKSALSSLIMAAAMETAFRLGWSAASGYVALGITMIIAFLVYFVFLYLINGIPKEDLRGMLKKE